MSRIPSQAEIVIIGGGIIGCSVAYHLAKLGKKDVLLLERKKLTSGTTWHAAGLVRAMLYSGNLTKLARHSIELYTRLEKETGQATGLKQNGSISIATNAERWDELRRGASMARGLRGRGRGDLAEARRRRCGRCSTSTMWSAPSSFPATARPIPPIPPWRWPRARAWAGSRSSRIARSPASSPRTAAPLASTTAEGEMKAEVVVNCAGMWAREVGLMAGVDVPLHAAEHFYVVTEPMDLPSNLPVMRNMDACAYYKEDAGKLLIGAFEPQAKPWGMNGIPEDFCFDELPEDFDHFQPILEGAIHRVPKLAETGIRKFFNGPESFSPDQRYLLGEAPDLKNFFVAAGFNSIGIQSAGGAGMALAEWIVGGHPPFDLWDVDIRRMIAAPEPQDLSARAGVGGAGPALCHALALSPVRDRARHPPDAALYRGSRRHGACFGEVAGWERANWFAPKGVEPKYEYSFGRQNWFAHSAAPR